MSEVITLNPSPPTTKRDARNACDICGWGPAYGVHLPALTGPNKGKPWGHAYRRTETQPPKEPQQ
jgi:hypothetical protein